MSIVREIIEQNSSMAEMAINECINLCNSVDCSEEAEMLEWIKEEFKEYLETVKPKIERLYG